MPDETNETQPESLAHKSSPNQQSVKDWMGNLGDFGEQPDSPPQSDRTQSGAPPAGEGERKTGESSTPPVPPSPATQSLADMPEDKWPRSAKEWKAFRAVHKEREDKLEAKNKEYEAKVKEYEEKLSKVTASPTSPEAYEALKKERNELDKRLQTEAVVRHPKFEEYFNNKTKAQLSLVKKIVGDSSADKFEKILSAPDSEWKDRAMEEALLELGPIQQARIGSVMNQLSEIQAEKQQAIDNAAADYAKLQENKANQEKSLQAQRETLLNETIATKQHPEKGMPAYQKREGDKAWNEAVESRINMVKSVMSGKGVTPKQIMEVIFNGVALQPVLEQALAQEKELSDLKAQIAKLSASTPRLSERGSTSNGTTEARRENKPGTRPSDVTSGWVKDMAELMYKPTE